MNFTGKSLKGKQLHLHFINLVSKIKILLTQNQMATTIRWQTRLIRWIISWIITRKIEGAFKGSNFVKIPNKDRSKYKKFVDCDNEDDNKNQVNNNEAWARAQHDHCHQATQSSFCYSQHFTSTKTYVYIS